MKDIIHFAHGNGFPGMCYKQMLDELGLQFEVCYTDKVGHDPGFPVSENWRHLVLELIDSITRQASQPVIAVGHSLGGVLSLLAAIERPELFKSVVLLDSPLLSPFKSRMVRLVKALGIIDRFTPAYRSRGRRKHWKTYEQLYQYLKTRDLFKTFSPECLEDYINYGIEKRDDGYHLRFDRQIEYQIYRTIPHTLSQYEGQLITPTGLIYGDKSTVVDRIDRRYMLSRFRVHNYKIEGTHLFPMEHPKEAAKLIIDVIDILNQTVPLRKIQGE